MSKTAIWFVIVWVAIIVLMACIGCSPWRAIRISDPPAGQQRAVWVNRWNANRFFRGNTAGDTAVGDEIWIPWEAELAAERAGQFDYLTAIDCLEQTIAEQEWEYYYLHAEGVHDGRCDK